MPEGAIGLLGPNGAGKTTMIRSLLGPDRARLRRRAGAGHGHPRRVGWTSARRSASSPRTSACSPAWSASSSSPTPASSWACSPSDALQRAHEVLDYVGLGEARYRRVESYSTGMKQRLKIASAIVHDPRLLILDEPTNGMDPAGREEILALARDLSHAKGMSLLFSSHLLPGRRGRLRRRRGAGPGPAAGPGADRRAQAASRPPVRGPGQGRPARLRRDGWRNGASRPSPPTIICWCELPPGASRRDPLGDGRRGRRAGACPASPAQHARRGLLERRGGTELMPILDQGYQHWNGTLGATPGGGWRSPGRGSAPSCENRWVWFVIAVACLPALSSPGSWCSGACSSRNRAC